MFASRMGSFATAPVLHSSRISGRCFRERFSIKFVSGKTMTSVSVCSCVEGRTQVHDTTRHVGVDCDGGCFLYRCLYQEFSRRNAVLSRAREFTFFFCAGRSRHKSSGLASISVTATVCLQFCSPQRV